jgi:molybdopterin/thiamine biosynthesis adenylyltransferase
VGRTRADEARGSVERSNLNRKILYSDLDLGGKKCDPVLRAVVRINPHVRVDTFPVPISGSNVPALVGDARLILDCLDNFKTRFVLNAFAVERGIPLIHAGVNGIRGQVAFIHPPHTPCLACMVPDTLPVEKPVREIPAESESPEGLFPILGATAGVVGSLQALETLKYLTPVTVHPSWGVCSSGMGRTARFTFRGSERTPDVVCARDREKKVLTKKINCSQYEYSV